MNYQFTITFSLPKPGKNPEQFLDALYEAGCSDALIGVGQIGLISLAFDREASDAVEAIGSAIEDVRKAIPQANIAEVSPDLVGMGEIADVLGVSRQMVRKYVLSKAEFPRPVHASEAVALWHLVEVVDWAETYTKTAVMKKDLLLRPLKEVSAAAFKLNFELQQLRQERLALNIIGAKKAKKLAAAVVKTTNAPDSRAVKKRTATRKAERAE
ncbi:DNA-binding protein [Ectothiorhodospiraceae bacterium 2226]|nr:DNA-binding protein [Ectothiorhodospiraceae bacterium 2226]